MNQNINDTICAISTPHGTGGIAVIRVSGPKAIEIVDKLWHGQKLASAKSHTTHLGELTYYGNGNEPLDQCVATIYRAPKSYTGEDTVEISIHGSKWLQRESLTQLQLAGCRLAEAGEYTRRAVINGRMDISQAEGVADIIASSSRAAHRLAINQLKGSLSQRIQILKAELIKLSSLLELELDFSEEDVEFANRKQLIDIAGQIHKEIKILYDSFHKGNAIKEGIPVAIIGATNAGKSSLINALLNDDRAIVSNIHGTTRDTIEEQLEIGDYLFRFIDTAGLRDTTDPIEKAGIERSRKAVKNASIILFVIDACDTENPLYNLEDVLKNNYNNPSIIICANKIDICSNTAISQFEKYNSLTKNIIPISALKKQGIDHLKSCILETVNRDNTITDTQSEMMITNLRHAESLRNTLDAIIPLEKGLEEGLETDLVAQHLKEVITTLNTITGEISSTDILNNIFSSFCIGK